MDGVLEQILQELREIKVEVIALQKHQNAGLTSETLPDSLTVQDIHVLFECRTIQGTLHHE